MTTTLGKYTLQQPLGRGGYGTVYLADETVLKVQRAVKLLHPALTADPSFIERFRHEAQVAARLEHAHIVPVYELAEDQGRYYLAMKYLPGGSLKDLLEKEGCLPYGRALQITRQIASALDFAHGQGLVHRDVKPGNILFEKDGTARLADFGFSKAMHGASSASLSATGGMIGTPQYMAPELWSGKPATPATDVYSLACVLCEMLSGEALFGGDSPAEIMKRHVLDGPQLPGKWASGVPQGFEGVLRRALERQSEDRYQQPQFFLKVLEFLEKEKVTTAQKPPEFSKEEQDNRKKDPASAGKEKIQEAKEQSIDKKVSDKKTTLDRSLDDTQPITIQKQVNKDKLLQTFRDAETNSKQASPPTASFSGDAGVREKTKQDLAFWFGISVIGLIVLFLILIPTLANRSRQEIVTGVTTKEVPSNKPNATLTADQLNKINVSGTSTAKLVTQTAYHLEKNRTATAYASKLTATAQSHVAIVEALIASKKILVEIKNGELAHEEDDYLEVETIYTNITDFILKADFVNPYASKENDWSYGVLFRNKGGNDQYRLSFGSDRTWRLDNVTPGSDGPTFDRIHSGTIENLFLSESQTNQITLAALGKKGYLIVNRRFISELDLSARTNSGSITLATGFYGDDVDGEVTQFKNVYLYSSTTNKIASEATSQPTSASCKFSFWPKILIQDIDDSHSVKLLASFYPPTSGDYEISIQPSRDRSKSSGYCEVKWPYPRCREDPDDPRYMLCSGIIGVNRKYALVTTHCVFEISIENSVCGTIYDREYNYIHTIK